MSEVAEDELSMIVWEGYLKKKTPRGVVKVWQSRYFRLLGDILEYYKSDKLGVCSGMIPLQMISSVKLHPRSKKGGCRFDVFVEGENAKLKEGARVFSLLAPSPALCAKLVRSLSNMIHAPADEQARMDLSHIDLSGEFWKRIDELEAERRRAGGVSNKNDLAQFAGFNIKRTQRKKRPGEGAPEDEAAAEAERARLAAAAGEKEHTTLAKLEREQLEAKLEEIEMPPIRIVQELHSLPIGKIYLARESESRVPFFVHAINRADEQTQQQTQSDAASLALDADGATSGSLGSSSKDVAAWTPAEVRELWAATAKLNHPFLPKLVSRGESADCLWVCYTMPHHAPLALHMAELLLQHREAMAFAQELNEDSDDEEAMAAPPLLLPVPVIQHLCCEILSLLDYLHTRGIVAARLDLKHLYLSAAGHIQLVDFFLLDAKEVGAAKRPERAEEIKAPEFYRSGSEDYRADFFRLGLVLYQLLTGCLPAGVTRFQREALDGAAKAAASVAHFSQPLNNVDEEPVKQRPPTALDPALAAKLLAKGIQSFDPALPSQLVFPSACPPALRDFITKLLNVDPALRLGGSPAPAVVSALLGSAGGDKEIALRSASIKDVQTHAWFHDDESAVDFPAFNRGVLLAQELLGGGGEGLPPNPPPAPDCVLNSLLLASHNHTYHRSTLLAAQRLDYRVSVLVKAGRNFSVNHVAGEKVDRRLSMVVDPAAIAAGLAAAQSQEASPGRDNGMSPAAAAALDAELNSPVSSAARGSTTKFYTKVLVDGKALKTPIVDSARNKNENHNEWVWNKRMTFTGDERILEADLTARVLAKDEDSFHDANIGSVTLPMRQLYGASAALWKDAQREAALRGGVAQGPSFIVDSGASSAASLDAYSPPDPCAVDSWFSVFGRDGFVVGELRLAIFVAQGEPRGGGQLAHALAPVTSRRRFSALFGSAFSSDLARDAAEAQPSEVSMAEIRKPQLVTLDGRPAPSHPTAEQLANLIPRRMLSTVQAAQGPAYHKPRMSILLMQHQATQRTLRATTTIGEEDEDEEEEEEKALAAHVNGSPGSRPPMTRGASTSVAGGSPPPAAAKDTPVNAIAMSPTGGAAGFLRGLVSKKKFRFQEGGFDLDLSYIGDRIIAMGFPSEGSEATYRNPMPQVQSFFKTFHPNQFKIYNLCSERHYDASKFGGVETGGPSGGNPECVRVFPFDDHNAPAFHMIVDLCIDAANFLNMKLPGDQENVVAIHCKAGKGRTGVMISCLEESTLVATYNGPAIPARDVSLGTVLVDPSGGPLGVVAVQSGESPVMYEVKYGRGSHVVTPNHLVSLRWNANPIVAVQPPLSDQHSQLSLSWYDAQSYQRHHKVWSILPPALVPYARQFALWWLDQAVSDGLARPLYNGDVFDIPACKLAALQSTPAFSRYVSIPMLSNTESNNDAQDMAEAVREGDAKERAEVAADAEKAALPSGVCPCPERAAASADSSFAGQVGTFFHAIGVVGFDPSTLTMAPEEAEVADLSIPPVVQVTPMVDRAEAQTTVQIVYMLHNPLGAEATSRNAHGERAFTLEQLEKARALLQADVTAERVLVTEGMNEALACRPRVIIALGSYNRNRWVAEASSLDGVERVVCEYRPDRINLRKLCIAMVTGERIEVQFAPHPCERQRFDGLVEALAEAHSVPWDLEQVQSRTWGHLCSRFVGITAQEGAKFTAIQVNSKDQRFVLADRAITHNCLLLYMGTCLNPDAALLYYGRSRTSNQQGVTIPSQRRYVHYFHHYLQNYYDKGLPFNFAGVPLLLSHVRLTGIPKLDMVSGGCDPSFLIFHGERCIFDSAQFALQPQGGQGSRSGGPGQISGSEGSGDGVGGGGATSAGGGAPVDVVDWKVRALVRGDCKILFVDRDRFGRRDKMCWVWFHTSFIAEQGHKPYLCLTKKDIDKAVKDKEHKTFPAHFKIEFFFKPQTDYLDPLAPREPLETVPTRDDDSDDSDAEKERERRAQQAGVRPRREVLQPWQMSAAHAAADLTHASLIADYQAWQSEQDEAVRTFQPAALS